MKEHSTPTLHWVEEGRLQKFKMCFSQKQTFQNSIKIRKLHIIKATSMSQTSAELWPASTFPENTKKGILKWKTSVFIILPNKVRRAAATPDASSPHASLHNHLTLPSPPLTQPPPQQPSSSQDFLNPNSHFSLLHSALRFIPGTFAWILQDNRKFRILSQWGNQTFLHFSYNSFFISWLHSQTMTIKDSDCFFFYRKPRLLQISFTSTFVSYIEYMSNTRLPES